MVVSALRLNHSLAPRGGALRSETGCPFARKNNFQRTKFPIRSPARLLLEAEREILRRSETLVSADRIHNMKVALTMSSKFLSPKGLDSTVGQRIELKNSIYGTFSAKRRRSDWFSRHCCASIPPLCRCQGGPAGFDLRGSCGFEPFSGP